MTATDTPPSAQWKRRPEFWEETGSGFRLSVFSGADATGPFFWAEVHPEGAGEDAPVPSHYQSPFAPTSEIAAAHGRAFIGGAHFIAADAADAMANAAEELGEEVEVACLSVRVNVATIRRLLRFGE